MKKALITGITGQDGSFLSKFLISKNYKVYGLVRRNSIIYNHIRLDEVFSNLKKSDKIILNYGDLTDSSSIYAIINKIKPDEVYNLAAQSHVGVSFENPEYTSDVNALGSLRILEAIRNSSLVKKTKFYQASSSELFGKTNNKKLNEKSKFYPRSPYAVAKLYAYWITKNYREAYNIYACNGILFNHESHQRGSNFVTKKITKGISDICKGKIKTLKLGNIYAKRDWGHASDYVQAQWLILQQKKPNDYVISTGKSISVKEFINKCFKYLNFKIQWKGKGINEKCYASKVPNKFESKINKNQVLISIDKKYFRPSEVDFLLGDSKKAFDEIGWKPKKNIDDLIKEMIDYDLG